MLLRSSISNEDSGPFRIIGQFRVCQNQPYPCEFNSFSVLVRKQATSTTRMLRRSHDQLEPLNFSFTEWFSRYREHNCYPGCVPSSL